MTQRDKMKEHNLVRKSLRKKDIGAYLVGKKKCRNQEKETERERPKHYLTVSLLSKTFTHNRHKFCPVKCVQSQIENKIFKSFALKTRRARLECLTDHLNKS